MESLESWVPRYNRQPSLHLRMTLDTHVDPDPITVLTLAGAVIETLQSRGFAGITLIHAGRGSTTVEVSVAREQAEIAKLIAETEKLRAEARFTNVKIATTVAGALYAAALALGFDVAAAVGSVGEVVREIGLKCDATECKLQVGDDSFSVRIPIGDTFPDAQNIVRANEPSLSRLFIWKGDEVELVSAVEVPQNIHEGSRAIIIGKLITPEPHRPLIRTPNGDFVLSGLRKLLPIGQNVTVCAEVVVDLDGAIYPVRIEVVGASDSSS